MTISSYICIRRCCLHHFPRWHPEGCHCLCPHCSCDVHPPSPRWVLGAHGWHPGAFLHACVTRMVVVHINRSHRTFVLSYCDMATIAGITRPRLERASLAWHNTFLVVFCPKLFRPIANSKYSQNGLHPSSRWVPGLKICIPIGLVLDELISWCSGGTTAVCNTTPAQHNSLRPSMWCIPQLFPLLRGLQHM